MKKVILLLLVIGFSLSLTAQNRQYDPVPSKVIRVETPALSSPRLEFDTLLPPSLSQPCGQSVVSFLVSPPNWGLLAGTNSFTDQEKAQRFDFTGSAGFNVQEIWGFFSDAVVVGDGDITAKVYSVDAASGAPDALLGTSAAVKTSAVVMPDSLIRPTIFTFGTPVDVADPSFFASIDISALYAAQDTAGLFTTNDDMGPCGSNESAWEKWSDNSWHTYTDMGGWGSDIDNVIGVMVEFFVTDIEDPKAVWRNLTLHPAYPNPASEQVSINFDIAESSAVEIVIYSIDGKVIQQVQKGTMPAGSYQEVIDVQGLAAGTYAYGVFVEGARLMNRFVISR
ncbi:MAG: T9SS type A sorting domain-containing protein [Bacteroidota bacterium]